MIRKRLKLPAEKAIFLFVSGAIPPTVRDVFIFNFVNHDLEDNLFLGVDAQHRLRAAQGQRRLPVHRVFGRECLRMNS